MLEIFLNDQKMLIPKLCTILLANILFVLMLPLATIMEKLSKKGYNNTVQNKIEQNLSNLKEQSTITNHLKQVVSKYRLKS